MSLAESGADQEAQIVQNSGDGFAVANFISPNHLFDFAVRKRFAGNLFVFLRLGFAGSQIFGEKNVHALFEKTWRGKNVEEDVETFCAVAGFFDQFAGSGAAGIFAIVDAACDEFPQELSRRVAILANQENPAVGQRGKNHHGPWVRDHFARDAQSAGLDDFIAANAEDRAFVNHFAANDFGGSAAGCFGRHSAYVFSGDIIHCSGRALARQCSGDLAPGFSRSFSFPNMPINTIIVDDEKPAREELAFLLKAFPEINVIGQGKNGVEAVALIKEHSPDLVFLDVQMPGLDGFGVLKKLVERKMKMPHVVFATAFDQYAVQAFDVNAVDYVLKPFDKARIAKAIQRARKMLDTQTSTTERLEQLVNQLGAAKTTPQKVKVLVQSQQRLLLVNGEDIIFATVDGSAIVVVTRDVEGSSNYRTLEELNATLDSESFWRPHRSFLVNTQHIKEVVPWFNSTFILKMNDKKSTEVPVSRVQAKRLRELFKL
jgi:two-component system, LytTR family, response regulator LytT